VVAELDVRDMTIRTFDLTADPTGIAPVRDRQRPLSPSVFQHRAFSGEILDMLRVATESMTGKDLATVLSVSNGLPSGPASYREWTTGGVAYSSGIAPVSLSG
jgi:hypothetical protein